ncbi:UDP-N-acetylmuramoyl-tripeptide--D-alanyl-D-alanine ligase [Candidatus Wolfebacteria bacterium]|nr:UDP-N-acetylmuramoyl-tripeptide--D-alanyl-D-alanine ligase [Candidatus Wolfebacteria bacterium]
MKLHNLLYLLQLEEYDIKCFNEWLKNNPGRIVLEIKKQIDWTMKAKLIFILASFFDILTFKAIPKISLIIAFYAIKPIDFLGKKIIVWRAKNKIKKIKNLVVIGITGSYGKTTTKDALFHILNQKYKTLKTEGNYNTLLGISKTIIKNLNKDHQIFICEIGAYQINDIKAVCDLIKPKIGIITAISQMHLERFKSLENIFKAKMELIESLSQGGFGFIPQEMERKLKEKKEWAELKIKAPIDYFSSKEELAIKIGKIFEINKEKTKEFLKTLPPTPHRQQIIKTPLGITIIDDAYNSNPIGFKSALQALKNYPAKIKILATPGMIELGDCQFELNRQAAIEAADIINFAIIIGETNKEALCSGLKEKFGDQYGQKVFEVKNLEEAKTKLSQIAVPNSIVLLENDLPDHYF